MDKIFTFMTIDHNSVVVLVAVFICILSSVLTVQLFQQARLAKEKAKIIVLAASALAGGFGVWTTNFVSILAYNSGFPIRFRANFIIISLFIAFATSAAALIAAGSSRKFHAYLSAGSLFGIGVATMQFFSTGAIILQSQVDWTHQYLIVSLVVGTLLAVVAFWFLQSEHKTIRQFVPPLLLTLSVLNHHFITLARLQINPEVYVGNHGSQLSLSVLFVTVSLLAMSLFILGVAMMMLALQLDRGTATNENSFKLLVEGVTDYAIYMLDLGGRVSNWNAGAQRIKGYSAEEILGRHFSIFYSEDDRRSGLPLRALTIARKNGKFEAEGWRYRKDGTSFWATVVIDPIYDAGGVLIGYAKITRDISKLREDADHILEVRRNLDVALENMSQGICLYDKNENLILSNRRYSEIFQIPAGAIKRGMTYKEILDFGFANSPSRTKNYIKRASDHYQRTTAVIRNGGGSLVHKLSEERSLHIVYSITSTGGWVATYEDITDRIRSEEQISYMAKHDTLTNLPNRAQFNKHLSDQIDAARRNNSRLAVVGIDLNNFKEINDQHGHAAGDIVLTQLAKKMQGVLERGEFVARFGGDEFAAVKQFDESGELHDFIGRIDRCLTGTLPLEGFEVKTGASIGIAIYPSDAQNAEMLLANADMAMYRAKNSLLNSICFYEPDMDDAARARRSLAKDLWAAIEKNQLHLHYQVQKSVASGEVTGYEVLLRWAHPHRGNVSPAEFITLAEECGAIVAIGEWVLWAACKEAASWPVAHKIAVNLSPIQLMNTDMSAVVHKVLLETGLQPSRLEIEITESSIFTDKERALTTLREIKNLGVAISIDDFGTGYSSLETLRAFPFDKIKLDKSFMKEVEESPQAKAIVRAILALGKSLEIPVLAEGVETLAQLEILGAEKCDEAQGYYLGRPRPISEIFGTARDFKKRAAF